MAVRAEGTAQLQVVAVAVVRERRVQAAAQPATLQVVMHSRLSQVEGKAGPEDTVHWVLEVRMVDLQKWAAVAVVGRMQVLALQAAMVAHRCTVAVVVVAAVTWRLAIRRKLQVLAAIRVAVQAMAMVAAAPAARRTLQAQPAAAVTAITAALVAVAVVLAHLALLVKMAAMVVLPAVAAVVVAPAQPLAAPAALAHAARCGC